MTDKNGNIIDDGMIFGEHVNCQCDRVAHNLVPLVNELLAGGGDGIVP
jgi:hypothetical protein